MTVRFDSTGPYEVVETDTPFARPAGAELLARIYRPRGEADRPLGIVSTGQARALPPVWVAQPDQDDDVPAAITDAFVKAYRGAGGSLEHAHFPGARHSFVQHASPDTDTCVALVRDFIGRQLRRS